jgi:hypothetical protein
MHSLKSGEIIFLLFTMWDIQHIFPNPTSSLLSTCPLLVHHSLIQQIGNAVINEYICLMSFGSLKMVFCCKIPTKTAQHSAPYPTLTAEMFLLMAYLSHIQ